MIRKIDHVAIAVNGLEEGLAFWSDALGLEAAGIETVETEGVKVAFLTVGDSKLELLEPTSDKSTVARYLEKRGGGIHHVTFEVSDLEATLDRLRGRNVEFIGEAPRPGAGGRQVAFVHPRSAGGVLVELVSASGPRPARTQRGLEEGSVILLYLREPQEKLWGVLRKLDTTGVVLEGIDLGSFDDWVGQVERQEEGLLGPSVLFIPMPRVEKILLDRSVGPLPSLAERFLRRIGRPVVEVIDEFDPGD